MENGKLTTLEKLNELRTFEKLNKLHSEGKLSDEDCKQMLKNDSVGGQLE